MGSRKAAGQPPLADSVYDILLSQFMDGSRPPAQPLNIAVLARELEVSQTPVREALARLEHTGLVHREALKGYRVAAPLTDRDIVALADARAVLEPALTLAAGRRVTPDFLVALRHTVEALAAAAAPSAETGSSVPARAWPPDERFHTLIAEQSGNRFLAKAYASLAGQVQRLHLLAQLGSRARTAAAEAAAEHRGIYDALASADAVAAAELMRRHVLGAATRAQRILRIVEERRTG
jgi:DNA-binding GntR family transcriptional regulator